MFKEGDNVTKKNGEDFADGEMIKKIVGFGHIMYPNNEDLKIVRCVWLKDYIYGPVRESILNVAP